MTHEDPPTRPTAEEAPVELRSACTNQGAFVREGRLVRRREDVSIQRNIDFLYREYLWLYLWKYNPGGEY